MKLGQNLFLLSRTDSKIRPVVVLEETVRRTLEGDTSVFTLFDGEIKFEFDDSYIVFESIESLRSHLIEKTTETIDKLISRTIERATFKIGYKDNSNKHKLVAKDDHVKAANS